MMHKIALELLAFATPSAELDEMRKVFYAIDTDGSGSISREEFDEAMSSHPELNNAALKDIFDQLDFAKKGEIGYNEFLAGTLGGTQQLQTMDEQTVRKVFMMLDQDADGIVSRDDLLQCLGGMVTDDELDEMFKQLGKKADGKLLFMDLFRLMTGRTGHKQAGIYTSATGRESSVNQRGSKPPSLQQLGKSATLSNVTLHSEAEAHNTSEMSKGARSAWAAKGRSVQNLNRFLGGTNKTYNKAELSRSAGGESSPACPSSPHRPRTSSADGAVMAASIAGMAPPVPGAAPDKV